MHRRGFLGMLASLPFIGRLVPARRLQPQVIVGPPAWAIGFREKLEASCIAEMGILVSFQCGDVAAYAKAKNRYQEITGRPAPTWARNITPEMVAANKKTVTA